MLSSCDSVGLLSPASAARINMGSFGRIVVIRRTGEDGSAFPVNQEVVSFGRDQTCTIRVRFEEVSRFHCTITVDAATRKASLHDKSSNGTILNGRDVGQSDKKRVILNHNDVFTIHTRSFRFEYPVSEQIKQLIKDNPDISTHDTPGAPGRIFALHSDTAVNYGSSLLPQTTRKHTVDKQDLDTPKRRKLSSANAFPSTSASLGYESSETANNLTEKFLASVQESPRSALPRRLMPTGATPLRISTTAPVENSSPGAPTPTSSRHATPDSPEGSPQEPSVAIKESQNTISHDDDVDNPFLETTIPQPHEESEEERESTPTPCGGNTVQNQEQMHQHIGLEKMLDTPRPTFPRKSSTPHPQSSRTVNPPPLVGSQSVPRYLGATASSRARQQDTVSTFRGVSPSFNTSRTARPGLKNPPSETIPADTESGAGEHVASDVKQLEVKAVETGIVVEDSQNICTVAASNLAEDVVMDATDLDSTPEAGAAYVLPGDDVSIEPCLVSDASMGGTSEVITESPDDQSKPVEEIEAPTHMEQSVIDVPVNDCLAEQKLDASNDEVESVGATRTPENESASAASNVDTMPDSAKKKVTFGPRLSPEVFHKHQPAATPLKRGDRRAPNDCPIAPGSVTKIPCTPGGSILKSALRRTLHHTASSPSKITKSGTPGSGLTVAQSSLKSASSKLKFSTPSNHSRAGVPMTTSKIPSSTVGFMTPKIGLPTAMSAMTVSPKKSLRDAFKYLPPAISGSGKTGFYGSTSIAAAVTTKTTVPTPTALDVAETPVKTTVDTTVPPADTDIVVPATPVMDSVATNESPRRSSKRPLSVARGLGSRSKTSTPLDGSGRRRGSQVGLDTPSSLTGRVRDSLAENTSPSCFVAAAVDNAVVVADGNGSVVVSEVQPVMLVDGPSDSDALILEDAVNQEISDAVDDVAAEMGSSEETAVDATQSGDLIEENHTLNEEMCDIDTVHDVAVVECEDDSRSNMATIAPSESLAESTNAVDLEAEFGDEDDTDIANAENLGGLVSPSSMALVEVAEREFDNDNEKTTNALDAQNDMVDCVMAESGMVVEDSQDQPQNSPNDIVVVETEDGQKLVETAESMNPTEDRVDDSDESEYEDVQVEVEVEVSMDENELAAVQVVVGEADVVAEGDDSMVDCAAVADTAEVLLVETTKPLELETGDEMVGVQDTAVQDTVQNTVVQATTVQDTSLDTADGECHFESLQGDCETVRAMDSTDNEELTALIAPAADAYPAPEAITVETVPSPSKKKTTRRKGRIPAAGHDDQHPSTVSPHHSQPVNSVAKVVELTEVEKTTPAPPRKRATRRSVRKLDVAAENVENGEMNCDPVAADSLFGPDEEIILLRPSSRCRSRTTSMDIALQVSEVIEQTDTEAGDILPAATVQTVVSPSPAPSIAIVSTGAKRKGKSAKHAHQFPVASFYKETSGLSSSEAKACGVAGEANLGVSVEDSAKPDGRSANNSGEHAMEVETIEKRDVEGADSQETLNHHDLRHRKDGEAPEAILPSDHKRRGRREAASKSSHSVAEDSEEVKMEPPKSGKRGGIRAAAPVNVLEESGDVHPKKKGRPAKQTPHVTTPHATTTNEVIYISEDEHVAAAPEAALEKPKKRGRPAKKTVEAVEVEPVVETIIASDTKPRHPPRSGRKQAQKVEEEKLDDEAGDIPVVLKSSRKGAKTNVAEVPSETVDEAKPSKRGGKAKNIHATPVEVLDASVGKDDAVVEEKKTGRSARSKRA